MNSRGPGDRRVHQQNLPPLVQGQLMPVPAWRQYFENLSTAERRRFAGIFGPNLVRTESDLEILNEALQDDGRIAKLTRPYRPQPVARRRMVFRNAYLQR